MKKLILTSIILVFLTSSQAQLKIEQDKVNHATAGLMIAYSSNALTYHFTERKIVAFVSGVGLSYLAGHLKEDYDMRQGGFYNNKDIKATVIGGLIGSTITSLITLRCVPKRKLPLEYHYLLDDENTMRRK